MHSTHRRLNRSPRAPEGEAFGEEDFSLVSTGPLASTSAEALVQVPAQPAAARIHWRLEQGLDKPHGF